MAKKEKLPKPEEMEEMVNKFEATGQNIDKLMEKLEGETDVKEKILKEIVNKLFDKDNLLMISRLDNNLAFYIIKHLIINNFYAIYYYSIKYEITIVADSNPPYYKPKINYTRPKEKEIIATAYANFISELLQVTISFKGEGRSELIKLYDALNERIRRDDALSNVYSKLGLAK